MKRSLQAFASVLILIVLLRGHALADETTKGVDWPQFHGPARNNTTPETGWRKEWPKEGPPVAWRAKVGAGMASFAVVDGRVFTMGNDGENQDTLFCLDLASGKPLWRHDYPCKSAAHQMPIVPGGPSATPCVGDGRVFTVSREGHSRARSCGRKTFCAISTASDLSMVTQVVHCSGKESLFSMSAETLDRLSASARPMAIRSGLKVWAKRATPHRWWRR